MPDCQILLVISTFKFSLPPSRSQLSTLQLSHSLQPASLHGFERHFASAALLNSTFYPGIIGFQLLLKMPEDCCVERSLFGGAITSAFPIRFQDVSNIRQVPDHQEVFVDPARDESLIFELLDLKLDVADNESATWFLQDLATEQDAEGSMIIQQSGVVEADGLRFRNMPAVVTTAVGQMAISKGRQGREAQNIVRVYLANLRLKEVGTDVLITAYEPILIHPLSESASTVGAGLAVPAAQVGCMPMAEVFKLAVSCFKVNDWSLFGAAAT